MKMYTPKMKIQLGYKCYLKITERTYIQKLIKADIKKLTQKAKQSLNWEKRLIINKKKGCMAKTYSKMEELFPDEPKKEKGES